MSFGRSLLFLLSTALSGALLVSVAPAAGAAEPTALALTAPGGYAGEDTTVTITLTRADGAPVPAAQVSWSAGSMTCGPRSAR